MIEKRIKIITANNIYILLCILLFACSSPESDGKKAAQKSCDCFEEYTGKLSTAYESYIENFNSYSFKTRIEAREKINKSILEVKDDYNICEEKAIAYRNELSNKYLTNRADADKFQYAYNAQFSNYRTPSVDSVAFQSRINSLIQTIIPQKPDLAKLKKDLIGRKISEGADGYRGKDWYWEIKSLNDLKNVEIKNEEDRGDDYLLDVYLLLQGENTDYEANVKISYVLRQYDDWTIDVITTENMNIVQTHNYDDCITIRLWGLLGEHRYEFTNSCDVSLLVGGVALSDTDERWEKFSILVDANSSATVGDMIQNRIKDCKIHFIERP